MKAIIDFVDMMDAHWDLHWYAYDKIKETKEYQALKSLLEHKEPPVVTEDMVELCADALRAECLEIYGSNWSNDVAARLANAALEAVGYKKLEEKPEPKKQTLHEYAHSKYSSVDIFSPSEIICLISEYLEQQNK